MSRLPPCLGRLQGAQQSRVLGHIVGRVAEEPVFFEVRLAAPLQDEGPRGRARIAAGAAVGIDDEFVFGIHHDIIVMEVICTMLDLGEQAPRLAAIETSHRAGWVALGRGERLLSVRPLLEARRHARDLAPMLAELLTEQGWKALDLDGVIVGRGPGSYTGLRVGLMSAKTLAYATGRPLLAVDTFAAVAVQTPAGIAQVDVIADAQQDKIYVQRFVQGMAQDLYIAALGVWLADLAGRDDGQRSRPGDIRSSPASGKTFRAGALAASSGKSAAAGAGSPCPRRT